MDVTFWTEIGEGKRESATRKGTSQDHFVLGGGIVSRPSRQAGNLLSLLASPHVLFGQP
jgi:hypothetical protein